MEMKEKSSPKRGFRAGQDELGQIKEKLEEPAGICSRDLRIGCPVATREGLNRPNEQNAAWRCQKVLPSRPEEPKYDFRSKKKGSSGGLEEWDIKKEKFSEPPKRQKRRFQASKIASAAKKACAVAKKGRFEPAPRAECCLEMPKGATKQARRAQIQLP